MKNNGSIQEKCYFGPPGKTRYSLYRRLGGPQGQSGQVQKISPPPGFDPRIVQPVVSRYTDYANQPNDTCMFWKIFILLYAYTLAEWDGNKNRSFATTVSRLKICDFSGETFQGFEVL
jgi:hypothetical protein